MSHRLAHAAPGPSRSRLPMPRQQRSYSVSACQHQINHPPVILSAWGSSYLAFPSRAAKSLGGALSSDIACILSRLPVFTSYLTPFTSALATRYSASSCTLRSGGDVASLGVRNSEGGSEAVILAARGEATEPSPEHPRGTAFEPPSKRPHVRSARLFPNSTGYSQYER